jgi:MHS family shikimate/dehydroshikimate transporter-like MFS transporter
MAHPDVIRPPPVRDTGVDNGAASEPSLFTRMFAASVRYTGMSVAYQVSAIAGGFTPLLSLWLLKQASGRPWLVAAFLVIVAAVSFACVTATLAGEPRRQPRHRMVTTANR